MRPFRIALALALCCAPAVARAQSGAPTPLFPGTAADREAVTRAALDYLEGFYEGDSAKLVRALRPDVSKYGFWRDSTGRYSGERMTYAEALAYAGRVKARNRPVPATWAKEVTLLEVQDRTAAAKVTAWWGTDYLLLGKYEDRWMISDVVWQGPPPKK